MEWWELADPPWELTAYICKFAQALTENQVWIKTGGVAATVTVGPPPTLARPPDTSDGKSEVGTSNREDLPSPKQVLSKVLLSDKVEHVLDKGPWAATPAMHIGRSL